MYRNYWGLRERPFASLPDLRFAYMSSTFKEGLARLRYAVKEDKGLTLLTGPVGFGKTYLLEKIRSDMTAEGHTVLQLINPNLSPAEMLLSVYKELCSRSGHGFEGFDRTNKTDLLEALTLYARQCVKRGKHVVLLVDDTQTIADPMTIEEIRLLLNLCTQKKYLVQVVLAGLPGLLGRVREFPSLCQRVEVSFQLEPLAVEETAPYIAHRLRVAGAVEIAESVFTVEAVTEVYHYAQGCPRLINNVCDMALLIASGERLHQVEADSVVKAASDRSVPTLAFGL